MKMKTLLSINENSTLPELLSAIRFSFEAKECEEITSILMSREEDLRRDFDFLKKERDLLRGEHCSSELEKLELEMELKKCRNECDRLKKKHSLCELEKLELENELKRSRIECDSLEKKPSLSELNKLFTEQDLKKKRKVETCEKDKEESGVETEHKRKIMELTIENEKLKEEIEVYGKTFFKYSGEISGIEEVLSGLLETNAGGHSRDSTSPRIKPSTDLTGILNSKVSGTMHICSTGSRENVSIAGNMHNSSEALSNSNLHDPEKDASDVKRVIIESVTAALCPEPAAPIDRPEPVTPSTVAVDRPEPEIYIVSSDSSSSDSDVESIADSVDMNDFVKNISRNKKA